MGENNHEVIIDSYVFPDTVTVTLANDEYIDSRDYVGKELYESVREANDVWQEENAKLRELLRDMWHVIDESCCRGVPIHPDSMREIYDAMRELGIEVQS